MPASACRRPRIAPEALVIDNAAVVTPEEVLEGASVGIVDGIIDWVGAGRPERGARRLDARGLWLLPGFVDLHSDAIETAIQPRPGGRFPVEMALRELDRTLVAFGITTMFHALSFSDSSQDSGLRASRTCAELARQVNRAAGGLLARTRVHLRFEVTETHAVPLVDQLLAENQVHFFSLMDHTPGQGQFADVSHFRTYYGRVRGKSAAELDRLIAHRIQARQGLDEAPVRQLVAHCRRCGIRVASHDDDTPLKVRWNRELGVSMAEFPVTLEAARAAWEQGMHVAFGAPNILRGGSATGNLSAREAIAAGYGDVICSDYAPMAMIHAALALMRHGRLPLPQVVRMLSANPSRAAGIDQLTGAIAPGKAADLVLLDPTDPHPRVVKTFVAGREVYACA